MHDIIKVRCPDLVEWRDWIILSCKKDDRHYVPDPAELQTYCKNKNFGKCPHHARSGNVMPTASNLYNRVEKHEVCCK